jgi:hypothetical protein
MTREVTQVWRESRERFRNLQVYVNQSYQEDASVEYKQRAYSSWVLLAYATAEASFVNTAKAAMSAIAEVKPSPAELSEAMRKVHRERTLRHLMSEIEEASFSAAVAAIDSQSWAEHSRLLSIERNVWVSESQVGLPVWIAASYPPG